MNDSKHVHDNGDVTFTETLPPANDFASAKGMDPDGEAYSGKLAIAGNPAPITCGDLRAVLFTAHLMAEFVGVINALAKGAPARIEAVLKANGINSPSLAKAVYQASLVGNDANGVNLTHKLVELTMGIASSPVFTEPNLADLYEEACEIGHAFADQEGLLQDVGPRGPVL